MEFIAIEESVTDIDLRFIGVSRLLEVLYARKVGNFIS